MLLDAGQVGRGGLAQAGQPLLGDHGERPARVRRTGLPLDQALPGQTVDQPGQPGPGQQHPVGQVGHPKPPLRALRQLQQHVVRGQRQHVPLGEIVLHLPGDAGMRAQERPPDRQFTGGESRAHGIMVGPWAKSCPAYAGTVVTPEQVNAALASVRDPEIRRPITELNMVKDVRIDPDGTVTVGVFLTVAGCPMRETHHQGRHRRGGGPRRGDRRAGRPRRDERRAAAGTAGTAARPGPDRERDPVRQARLADPGVRGGLGQGRRGQVVAHRQPRGGAGRPRPVGRGGGRRHLRAQRAADARGHRPADPGRADDPAAAGAAAFG